MDPQVPVLVGEAAASWVKLQWVEWITGLIILVPLGIIVIVVGVVLLLALITD